MESGDTVYVADPLNPNGYMKGKLHIYPEWLNVSEPRCKVDIEGFYDFRTDSLVPTGGCYLKLPLERVYSTVEELLAKEEMQSKKWVVEYKKMINSVEDLVKFPLKFHVMGSDDYVNKEARQAYLEKAMELTGITESQLYEVLTEEEKAVMCPGMEDSVMLDMETIMDETASYPALEDHRKLISQRMNNHD